MPRAYSMDLRKRVIEACDRGETIAQVAQRFAVSPSFVNKLQQRRRKSGTLEPKPHGGGRQPLLFLEHDEMLRTLLAAQAARYHPGGIAGQAGAESSPFHALVSPPAPRPDLQKKRWQQPSKGVRMCAFSARLGNRRSRPSIRPGSFSLRPCCQSRTLPWKMSPNVFV